MNYFKIEKTEKLSGEIDIQGSKNSVLPIMAASIMADDVVAIYNCPEISDVYNMIEILKKLNCTVSFLNNVLYIDSTYLKNVHLDSSIMSKTRGAVVFLGALISRFGEASISFPGGCNIGNRPIDIHIEGISKLNVAVSDDKAVEAYTEKVKGNVVELRFPSVGATENIMMAAVKCEGVTYIRGAAREPEIIELQDFLNAMGADIRGAGTDCIVIKGVKHLHSAEYHVVGDRIVAVTYMAAVAAVGGKVKLKNIMGSYLREEIMVFRRMGCYVKCRRKEIIISRDGKRQLRAQSCLETNPFPALATDAGPLFLAALLKSDGISVLKENIFDNRFKVFKEFEKMGAYATVFGGKIAVVYGNDNIKGTEVEAEDLRGGAALIIAGLTADGITKVHNVSYIKRGYEDIIRDLKKLGALISEEMS